MSLIRSLVAVAAIASASFAVTAPASAYYDENGNIIYVVYMPDGSILV